MNRELRNQLAFITVLTNEAMCPDQASNKVCVTANGVYVVAETCEGDTSLTFINWLGDSSSDVCLSDITDTLFCVERVNRFYNIFSVLVSLIEPKVTSKTEAKHLKVLLAR